MRIEKNFSLKGLNTFGIDARAENFSRFESVEELEELCNAVTTKELPFILGGGSNILLTGDIQGWVLKNEIGGIRELHEDSEYVYVKAGAGENWHGFVLYCINRGWAGIENLSLIPGNVGASPIQNIGAYGVELEEVFWELEALHLRSRMRMNFTPADCAFNYRDSVFKNQFRGEVAILNVTFRLRKQPRFNTSYGAIGEELEKMGVKDLSIKAISDAVTRIRSSKLPDPKVIGNAGSFFKNPEITALAFEALKSKHPGIVGHELANRRVKLAAGWLIEQCGFKGMRRGDAGVHDKQSLVLVNYGKATGEEILQLSKEIVNTVNEKFGVTLEREVNVV